MAVNIGPRIGIDGEKEYRDEINRIIQQGKTLASEMNAVTAAFTDATSEEEKNKKIGEVLEKQIKNQRERIKKLTEMMERSATQTGETSTETLKWQEALNNAKAELAKLESQTIEQTDATEKLNGTMKDGGKEAVSFGTLLKANIASDLVIKGLEKMVEITKKVIETAANAVKGLGKLFVGTASWADDMLTLSTNTGISTDRLQEFEYMAERIDTDLETITDAMARNIRSMKSTAEVTEDATEAGEEYARIQEQIAGITEEVEAARAKAERITAESAKRAADAMKDVRDATFEVERAQIAYDNAAQKSGKRSTDAKEAEKALAEASERLKKAQEEYNDAVAEGKIAAEELVARQSELTDAQTALAGIQSAETKSVNEMTEAYQKLGVKVYDVATGELRDSEQVFFEVIDALGKIENRTTRDALSMTIFGRSAQDLNSLIVAGSGALKEYADEAQRTGYVQEKSTLETLAEFSDKIDEIKKKVKQMGTELATFIAPFVGYIIDEAIPVLDNLNGKLKGLFSGEVSAEEFVSYVGEEINRIKDKITETLPGLIAVGKDVLSAVGKGISDNKEEITRGITNAVKWAIEGTTALLADLAGFGLELVLAISDGIAESMPDLAKAIGEGLIEAVKTLTDPKNLGKLIESAMKILTSVLTSVQTLGDALNVAAWEILKNTYDYLTSYDWVDDFVTFILNSLKDSTERTIKGFKDYLIDPIKKLFTGFLDDPKQWGKDLIDNFLAGINSKIEDVKTAFKNVGQTIKDFIGFSEPKKGPLSNFHTFAPDMIDLFCKGLKDSEPVLKKQLSETFGAVPTYQSYANIALARNAAATNETTASGSASSYNYGGVSINVYGSEGQSAREIAENVLDVLQSQISGKERAFA